MNGGRKYGGNSHLHENFLFRVCWLFPAARLSWKFGSKLFCLSSTQLFAQWLLFLLLSYGSASERGICPNKLNPKFWRFQAFTTSSHFNFHGWLHSWSKVRPLAKNLSIGFMYPWRCCLKLSIPLSFIRDKSNYQVHNRKKKTSVLCNDHLPVTKTMRQRILFFFF